MQHYKLHILQLMIYIFCYPQIAFTVAKKETMLAKHSYPVSNHHITTHDVYTILEYSMKL